MAAGARVAAGAAWAAASSGVSRAIDREASAEWPRPSSTIQTQVCLIAGLRFRQAPLGHSPRFTRARSGNSRGRRSVIVPFEFQHVTFPRVKSPPRSRFSDVFASCSALPRLSRVWTGICCRTWLRSEVKDCRDARSAECCRLRVWRLPAEVAPRSRYGCIVADSRCGCIAAGASRRGIELSSSPLSQAVAATMNPMKSHVYFFPAERKKLFPEVEIPSAA